MLGSAEVCRVCRGRLGFGGVCIVCWNSAGVYWGLLMCAVVCKGLLESSEV